MIRGQVRELTTIRKMNTAHRSREIFSGYMGRKGRPQLIIVRLTVVKFIFLRLTEGVKVSLLRKIISLAFLIIPLLNGLSL